MAQRRAARGGGIIRWLLPASVLHAAVALLAAALARGAGDAAEHATPALRSAEPEWIIELTLLDDGELESAAPSPVAGSRPRDAATPPARDDRRTARVAFAPRRPDAARRAAEPRLAIPSDVEVGEGATAMASREEPAASASAEASSTLSLEQLGIGANPFLGDAIQPPTQEEQAKARLHAALHPLTLARDHRHGLGPAGPVAAAARQLVLADDTLVETSAVLNVRVDGAGRVTEVHVLDASSQAKAWQLVAARLAQALAPVKLRAEPPQGWGMKLRLASTVQLPSGAAPGMRLGVLGQQVAGSGGPRSTGLELSPSSKFDIKEPIDSVGRHMDDTVLVEVMLLKFRADPADLGATARRVVEVAVLSIDPPAAP